MKPGHSAFSFKNEGAAADGLLRTNTVSFLKEKAECPHWVLAAFASRLTEISA
jgi:hypothetical protein